MSRSLCFYNSSLLLLQGACTTSRPKVGATRLFLLDAIMVDVYQWRAAIGLWNCCRLRITSPNSSGLSPNCSSSGANSNDGTVEDNHLTTRKNGGSYFCVRFCLDFCALRFAPEALCKCLWRSLVSRETLSCMIYYLLFFLFLLLLSGDVELNPGPITVEQGNRDCLY